MGNARTPVVGSPRGPKPLKIAPSRGWTRPTEIPCARCRNRNSEPSTPLKAANRIVRLRICVVAPIFVLALCVISSPPRRSALGLKIGAGLVLKSNAILKLGRFVGFPELLKNREFEQIYVLLRRRESGVGVVKDFRCRSSKLNGAKGTPLASPRTHLERSK